MEEESLQLIINRLDSFEDILNDKFTRIETNISEKFEMCNKLCILKIKAVDVKAEKSHERLNKHKESLENLCEHKNQELGARRATMLYMGILTLLIAGLGVAISLF